MPDGTLSTLQSHLHRLFPGRFISSEQASEQYGTDTGGSQRALRGAVKVIQADEVFTLIDLACEYRISLWPISGGRNFGYGTSLPVQDNALIVDMTSLKSIEFHPESHTVTIGAGVTQADLLEFLSKHNLPYLVPTTGAGPHGSLIGNALDGGYGMTPVSDHFDGLVHFQGYWGNGEAMSDSLAELSGPDMARRWNAGTGLNARSLLRQSNLGIVTAATLQLAPKQPYSRMVVIQWNSQEDFERGQEALAELMETIPAMTAVLSVNKPRTQATNGDIKLRNPSSEPVRAELAAPTPQEFTSLATLFGPEHATAGACRDLKKRLSGARVLCLTRKQLTRLGQLAGAVSPGLLSRFEGLRFLHQKVSSLSQTIALLDGVPSHEFLKLAYAANNPAPAMHFDSSPAKDGQGILWFAPLVPVTKTGVHTAMVLIESVLVKHGFDALLGMTIRNSRAGIATIPLIFEKTEQNVQRAHACYKELVTVCTLAGMPPYRSNIESMATIKGLRATDTHSRLHACLKAALDPANIIAPGRYS